MLKTDLELEQEIHRLRTLNLAPKQIARKLSLRPAEVSDAIRRQAQASGLSTKHHTMPPLVDCWVDGDTASALATQSTQSLYQLTDKARGLSVVTVVRQPNYDHLSLCTYLVDYWCLGVKNAMGLRKISTERYISVLEQAYGAFDEGYQQITLEQAQAIVLSTVEYAEHLGFHPHRDFKASQPFLGDWDGSQRLECRRNGKPCYFCGPHDNQQRILETLEKNVGKGNFDFLAEVSPNFF
jgi:hypothetical protein